MDDHQEQESRQMGGLQADYKSLTYQKDLSGSLVAGLGLRPRRGIGCLMVLVALFRIAMPEEIVAETPYTLVQISQSYSPAFDVNDNGAVVGAWFGPPVPGDPNTQSRGYIWTLATGAQPMITDLTTVNKFPFPSTPVVNSPIGAVRINATGTIGGDGCPNGCGLSGSSGAIWTSAQGLIFVGSFDNLSGSSFGGLNNAGQVVGLSGGGGYNQAGPFIWSTATGIQTLSGLESSNIVNGSALGINNNGQVVGSKGTGQRLVAFVWSPTALTDVPDIPGATSSEGFSINDSGVVVGRAFIAPDNHAVVFRWSADTGTEDLNAPAGYVELLDINNAGDIVATISPPTGGTVPYLYRDGAWTNLNDLLPTGTDFTLQFVEAINNQGWIVGAGTSTPPTQTGQGFVLIPATPNRPPVLAQIGNKTVKAASSLTFKVSATDPDPQDALTFSLGSGSPAGATIDAAGNFSWTPSNKQGPMGKQESVSYPVTVRVTDNGSPTMSDSETIFITVTKKGGKP